MWFLLWAAALCSQVPLQLGTAAKYNSSLVARFSSPPPLGQVWGKNYAKGTVDVQLTVDDYAKVRNMSHEVMIPNLASAISDTFPAFESTSSNGSFFSSYQPLDAINDWLDSLEGRFDTVKIENIGSTFEGRPFRVVHVSLPGDDHAEKRTIVVTGGIHAREWISVLSALYSLFSIVDHFDQHPDHTGKLSKLDFLFVPVMNPDGYAYTWTHDRLWRKNRQTSGLCTGLDIDHSFNFHWTPSEDACGEEYAGSRPLEAHEARIWNNYLNTTNTNHKIWGYIDLHLYAQEILYPYAYSCEHQPRDEENLLELAYGISKAIRNTSGKFYNVLPACLDRDADLMPDLGAGTALDYMYHNRAYWALQIKLRDSGLHGFLLPARYIEPVGQEIAAAFRYFCKFILSDR